MVHSHCIVHVFLLLCDSKVSEIAENSVSVSGYLDSENRKAANFPNELYAFVPQTMNARHVLLNVSCESCSPLRKLPHARAVLTTCYMHRPNLKQSAAVSREIQYRQTAERWY